MFNDSKVKKIQDQVNNLEKDAEKKQTNNVVPDIKAKILGGVLDQSRKIYLYQWQAIDYNGVYDDMGGASNDAICIQELGQDMTNQSMSVQVNDIVSMQCDQNGYRFSKNESNDDTNEFLDLYSEINDNIQWLKGLQGANDEPIQGAVPKNAKLRILIRQFYDYQNDRNFEYYRELTFSPNGKLIKVDTVVKVDGFETTLHT